MMTLPQIIKVAQTRIVFPNLTARFGGGEHQNAHRVFGVGERVVFENGQRMKACSPVREMFQILNHGFGDDPHRLLVVREGLLDGEFEHVIEDVGVAVIHRLGCFGGKIGDRRGAHAFG